MDLTGISKLAISGIGATSIGRSDELFMQVINF